MPFLAWLGLALLLLALGRLSRADDERATASVVATYQKRVPSE